MAVCGHWGKRGVDCVIKERTGGGEKKACITSSVLPTGKPVLFTLSLWPLIFLFFFFPLQFMSLIYAPSPVPVSLSFFLFFILWSFPCLFQILMIAVSMSCPSYLPVYSKGWDSNSRLFLCFLITYYLSICIGFLLHWQEHATVRLSAELIQFLCLDTKQYRFAVADEFIFSLSSTLGQQHICFLIFPWVAVIMVFFCW